MDIYKLIDTFLYISITNLKHKKKKHHIIDALKGKSINYMML